MTRVSGRFTLANMNAIAYEPGWEQYFAESLDDYAPASRVTRMPTEEEELAWSVLVTLCAGFKRGEIAIGAEYMALSEAVAESLKGVLA